MMHAIMSMGGVLSMVIIISDLICAESDDPIRSQLFSTSIFMVGIGTVVNTAFGIRLPVFQGPSSTFLVPLLALRSTGEWTCPAKLQGSLMLSSLFEVITGATGLIGVIMRYIGPITMSVTIILIGLGLYEIAIYFFTSHWGISGFSTFLMIAFSMYLDHIKIPLPNIGKEREKKRMRFPLFQTFPVLLSIFISWALCGILTVSGVLSDDPESSDFKARTDTKFRIIDETPWFYFPYPGQFGMPRFNTAIFIGFLVAVINSAFESIGDYYATAQACQVAPPPKHALNRGIFVEGIMSVISGAVGAGHATTTYSNHVAIISLTKIGSRLVLIVAGLMAIVVAILSKFGAVFSLIPDPALGGTAFVSLGLVTSLGISILQKVDLTSSRNLAVIGVSIYSGVVFPEWIKQYPEGINTGNIQVDQVIKVLLGTPMFLGSIVAFILDNTVKGTLVERGMCPTLERQSPLESQRDHEGNEEANNTAYIKYDGEGIYNLPGISFLQDKIRLIRFLPFVQPSSTERTEE